MIYLIVFLLWSFGQPPPWLSQRPLPLKIILRTLAVFPCGGKSQYLLESHSGHLFLKRGTPKSRLSSMHSPRHGGCGNVIPLPSLMGRADRPWEAALWSVCSQNTGTMFPSASVSVSLKFSAGFLLGQGNSFESSCPPPPSSPRKCRLEQGSLPLCSVPKRSWILGNETDLPQFAR